MNTGKPGNPVDLLKTFTTLPHIFSFPFPQNYFANLSRHCIIHLKKQKTMKRISAILAAGMMLFFFSCNNDGNKKDETKVADTTADRKSVV